MTFDAHQAETAAWMGYPDASAMNDSFEESAVLRLSMPANHRKQNPDRLTNMPEYWVWHGMRQRCLSPKHKQYSDYGGRGISVCSRWSDFRNFIADMGRRPDGGTLDRRDVNGDYTPENCRWATRAEQMRNRRDNVFVTIDGETKILKDWAKELGISPNTVRHRVGLGLSLEQALILPVGTVSAAKSGIRGVYYHPDRAKPWQARLKIDGRFKSLGYFETVETARDALAETQRLIAHHKAEVPA